MLSNLRRYVRILMLGLLVVGLSSCVDLLIPVMLRSRDRDREEDALKYTNLFAKSALQTYYLWNEEVAEQLDNWLADGDPAAQVLDARYRSEPGVMVDRWTQLIPNIRSFQSSVAGESADTYGYDLKLMYRDEAHTEIAAVVILTYDGGPASQAGLKRGDVIVRVNGKKMTPANYVRIVEDELLTAGRLTLTLEDGREVTLSSAPMYENPVLAYRILEEGSRRVGYLAYNGFTPNSYQELITVCKGFRAAGISDLILDLRYNGGGYAVAEEVLASMLAPEPAVQAGELLSTEIYNRLMMEYFASRGEDTKKYFRQDFAFQINGSNYRFSTADANARPGRIFAIVTGSTASASEALLCDLMAYMPVYLVGEQTHGKFCAGFPLAAEDYFDDVSGQMGAGKASQGKRATKDIGLYVMVSRFTDKNGETRCMPDGLAPDYPAEDNPLDGCQLGDPSETMLSLALSACGFAPAPQRAHRATPARRLDAVTASPVRAGDGYRILSELPAGPVE